MELSTRDPSDADIKELKELILNAENFGKPFLDGELNLINECLSGMRFNLVLAINDGGSIVGYLIFKKGHGQSILQQ